MAPGGGGRRPLRVESHDGLHDMGADRLRLPVMDVEDHRVHHPAATRDQRNSFADRSRGQDLETLSFREDSDDLSGGGVRVEQEDHRFHHSPPSGF